MPKILNRKMSKVAAYAGAILVTMLCTAWTMKVNNGCKSAYISSDKMNVLYLNLENVLTIVSDDYRPDQLEIRGVGATVGYGDRGYYIWPVGDARECTVQLTDKATKKLVREQHFRILPLPKPEVLLGVNPGPWITLSELQKAYMLNAGVSASFFVEAVMFSVEGYTFTHASKEGKGFYQVKADGNRFTPEIKEHLTTVNAGDIILISDVRVMGPGGKRNLPGIFFTVK